MATSWGLAPFAAPLQAQETAAANRANATLSLPAPSGPYAAGSRWLALVDSSRIDSLAPTPGAQRQILVRVWYPAAPVHGAQLVPLWPAGLRFTRALSAGFGLPDSTFDRIATVPSHTYADAPVARRGRPFPVVLFSHGYAQGFESQNSVQMEELASHGYVAVS
ncbi:MAG: acetylhydrolase, partial [Gemmatimonadaceae bacterium]